MKVIVRLIYIFTIAALLVGCAGAASKPITAEELETRARDFISSMEAGDYKAARQNFDRQMKLALSQQKLEDVWNSLEQQAGTFVQQGEARFESEMGYTIVYVTCRFGLAALDTKVVFNQKGQISGLFFQPAEDTTAMAPQYQPPAYADETKFSEEEVIVGEGEWLLPGTLTIPTGDGPFPAVVLVHGSGPNDRDESIGPNRVFKDLAWGLATQGIVVLRYEKRTREYADRFSGEMMRMFTVQEEVIDDALAAVELLQARPEIDPAGIFVLGHSLGATLAPRIAAQTDQLAGIIMLAAAARPIEDLMLEQSTYLANSDGTLDSAEKRELAYLEDLVEQVKALPENPDADPDALILGAAPAYWLDLLAYDPVAVAEDLSLPMLILQGERDYQVTMTDFAMWENALSGRDHVELRTYPALNHQFFAGEGPSLPGEYQNVSHLDAQVIDDIAAFIKP